MTLRESRHLTQAERDAIRSAYIADFKGDHGDTCDRVARAHGVREDTVRLLMHEGAQESLPDVL